MNFILQRYSDNRESTLGLLFKLNNLNNLILYGYSLEDEYREVKVKGETRIPAGNYEIVINRADTPLTLKYRHRYSWFRYHLMIKDVPNFTGIYFHVGRNADWTDGCITIGNTVNNNKIRNGEISDSVECFRKFYEEVYDFIETTKSKVSIEIRDEKNLL